MGQDDADQPILILRNVFSKKKLLSLDRSEIYEVIRTSSFLNLSTISERLNGGCEDENDACSLLYILEFFELDYVKITRKRLQQIGVSRLYLINWLNGCVENSSEDDLFTLVEDMIVDNDFLANWIRIQPIANKFSYLLDLYLINLDVIREEIFLGIDDLVIESKNIDTSINTDCFNKLVRYSEFQV